MDRNYTTTHQGIAAYIMSKGHQIVDLQATKNKQGRDTTRIELNVDVQLGKDMGDAFYNGDVNGNLKEFYDNLAEVRQAIWKSKA